MNSGPFSRERTGLWKLTFGIPGITPRTMSSMLGCVAAVIATVSPSQPRPAVIQSTSTCAPGREVVQSNLTAINAAGAWKVLLTRSSMTADLIHHAKILVVDDE